MEITITHYILQHQLTRRLEHLERAAQVLVDEHSCAGVVILGGVVWRTEERDELPVCEELCTVLHNLKIGLNVFTAIMVE